MIGVYCCVVCCEVEGVLCLCVVFVPWVLGYVVGLVDWEHVWFDCLQFAHFVDRMLGLCLMPLL